MFSGSNDHTTKFWCRNRPGDNPRDALTMQNQGSYVLLISDIFSRHKCIVGVQILYPYPYE